MYGAKFETYRELSLKVSMAQGSKIFTKAGAFVAGMSQGGKNYQFEKVLLGPQGNPLSGLVGQIGRRLTGENMPLMKVTAQGACELLFAWEQNHVVCINIPQGQRLSVESENLLAFNDECNYSIRFLAQGVISQKGLATSTLTANGPNAWAAVIIEGNPIELDNTQNGLHFTTDPDATVCWLGADPGFKLDLSWKNIIGQASGESYMFEWTRPANIIIQPCERKSGINIGMDGGSMGQGAGTQNSQSIGGALGGIGDTLGGLGNSLGGGSGSGGGLGGMINNLLR